MNKKLLIFLITLSFGSLGYYIVKDNNLYIDNFFHIKDNNNEDNQDLINTNDNNGSLNISKKAILIIIGIIIIVIIIIILIVIFSDYSETKDFCCSCHECPERNEEVQQAEKKLINDISSLFNNVEEEEIFYKFLNFQGIKPEVMDSKYNEVIFCDEPPQNDDKKIFNYHIFLRNQLNDDRFKIIKAIRLSLIHITDKDSYQQRQTLFFDQEGNKIKNDDYVNAFINEENNDNKNLFDEKGCFQTIDEFEKTIDSYLNLDFGQKEKVNEKLNNNNIFILINMGDYYYTTPGFLFLYLVCHELLKIYHFYDKYEEMDFPVRAVYFTIKDYLKAYKENVTKAIKNNNENNNIS